MCISARIGIAMIDSCSVSVSQSYCFSSWPTYFKRRLHEWWPHEFVFCLLQSLARMLETLIQVCFHPLPTGMMWLFIAGVSVGWDSVDVTSFFRSLFPVLYQPCRFCLVGVWIYWFVGLIWTLCSRQRPRCGPIHTAHFGCVRPRFAKLIHKHRYFVGHRCRRTAGGDFRFCNMRYPVKPHIYPCHGHDMQNKECFDSNNSFLQRHLILVNEFFDFLPHAFWSSNFLLEGVLCCIKKGVKLQISLFRLLASIYFCQIHLFAINWMIYTSGHRLEWFQNEPLNSCGELFVSCYRSSLHHGEHGKIIRGPSSKHNCKNYHRNISTPFCARHSRQISSFGRIHTRQNLKVIEQKGCWTTPLLDLYDTFKQRCFNPFVGVRIGEASNPGPETPQVLDIGTFNPTQLLHKEDDVIQWGQGIYTACETSVTPVAHQILHGKFRRAGWYSRWSKHVSPQQPKTSQTRGKAGGTAILSSFPLMPYVEPCPEVLRETDRFCEGVAQVHCNTNVYISAVYGFPIANAYLNALQMNNDLFTPIAERALNFQGPAVISGDFNCDLKDLVAWKTLQGAGWHDAALLDGHMYGRTPQPTCREATRRSFVLINSHLASKLLECRTCDDYLFSSHPLLLAKINLQNLIQPQLVWSLPKATDDLIFDPELQTRQVTHDLSQWGDKFHRALENHEADKAATLFARMVQNSWVASNVDVEGNHIPLQKGFLGRDRIQLLSRKQCSIPIIHKGRESDFEPICCQTSVSIRRHTRQLRRLQSLVLQVNARDKNKVEGAYQKCQELWESILGATGFHKSFSWWIGHNLGWFVPQMCPNIEYLESLKDIFSKWHNDEQHRFYLHRQRTRRISVALDAEKGGRLAFQELKDPPLAPLTFLTQTVEATIVKLRWPKKGLSRIRLEKAVHFDPNLVVHFQNQTAQIRHQNGTEVTVDPPLRLRSQNMTIVQYNSTADPSKLQDQIAKAWNQHWTRDAHPDQWEEEWKDIGPVLNRLPDLPAKTFRPFTLELWAQHCKKLNRRSSRGGCGFSVVEMLSFPPLLIQQLFKIFDQCEQGMSWPSGWVTAKVCMLSKCENPKSPFDARPITVFGVLYRQWSRIRSREILQYMASFMPVELAASTKGIAADAVACLITHVAETAINKGESICGIGIDLTRCFNTIPRYPVVLALRKLGVPEAYIRAWKSMLNNMTRTLTIGTCQSTLLSSTTGAPEGCGMSVVAMACITFWCGRHIIHNVPVARPICYADNWNVLTRLPHILVESVQVIDEFVQKLRLSINPKKSWLWSTRPSHRKALKGTSIGNDVLPVVSNTSDLGCDLHYSQKVCKPTAKKRWNKARRVCGKIAISKAPKGFRRKLAKGAGISASNFGLTLQHVPKTQWKSLRTAISRALGLCGAGASPWLALATNVLDPQLGNLTTTCRFWRRFLNSFPTQIEPFVHNLLTVGKAKVGPVANFRKTLNAAGWTFLSHTILEHKSSHTQVPWLSCSNKHLTYVFQKVWPWTITAKSPNRKDWNRTVFDIPMFDRMMQKRDPRHSAILYSFASGKHFTHDVIHKYDKTVDPGCPFCSSLDSKHHRLFCCPALEGARKKFNKTVRWASKQDDSLKFFGLLGIQPTLWDKIRVLCPPIPSWEHPPPDSDGDPWYLFLDGSAFGQTRKDIALSAWAVVKADYMVHRFKTLVSNFTQSWEHSSYRAEVAAILGALQLRQHVHLFSDCQAAVDTLNDFIVRRNNGESCPQVDHNDLWFPIWDLLSHRPCHAVTITKVTAHCDTKNIKDPLLKWYSAGNNFTDLQAKDVILKHPVYKQLLKMEKDFATKSTLASEYLDYICAVTEATYALKPKHAPQVQEVNFVLPAFEQWGPTNGFQFELPEFQLLPKGCPFGQTFYDRVRGWFAMLRWPVSTHDIRPTPYIGLLELYFDFVLVTQTESPVNIGKRPVSLWRLLDEHSLLQSPPSPLSRHTYSWTCFWKWCFKHSGVKLPFEWVERTTLNHIGYTLMSTCISHRPRLVCNASSKTAWDYFHPVEGRRRDLNTPLRPLPRP